MSAGSSTLQATSQPQVPATAHESVPAGLKVSARPLVLLLPAWLVSLVLHLLLCLTFSIVMIQEQVRPPPTYITGATWSDGEALEEPVFLPPELELLQTSTTAPSGEAIGPLAEVDGLALSAAPQGSPNSDAGEIAASNLTGAWQLDLEGTLEKPRGGGGFVGAEFFGVPAVGKRFVFIVDSSNSMKGDKFSAAKDELLKAIKRLKKDQFFLVMFFDRNTEAMIFYPKKEAEKGPAIASPANIEKLSVWMRGVTTESSTNPYEAVQIAMNLSPDAIYLLSDGKFTDKGKTIDYLQAENHLDPALSPPGPKVVVHTIAFYNRDGEEAMQFIAKHNGGTYRFVPKPKK